MCKVLNISRATLYYKPKGRKIDSKMETAVIKSFKESKKNYGTRKIKDDLNDLKIVASRRKIGQVMKKYGLKSQYTIKQQPKNHGKVNEDNVDNLLKRKFKADRPMQYLTSDLTYIKVGGKWHYICLIIDLFNREIVGQASGPNKDANLVLKAFNDIQGKLSDVDIFHTDRGSEFKNEKIEQLLISNNIQRSLSAKGKPIDNAVSESTYKIIKTEFAFNRKFNDLEELSLELFDYVNWFNNKRKHGSLNYKTPVQFRLSL